MKKHYLMMALMAIISVGAAAQEAVFIDKQPEGTLHTNMSKKAYRMENMFGFLYGYDVEGVAVDVVETDDAIYVRDPFSLATYGEFETNYWMKGTKAEGDTVVFESQPILPFYDYDDMGNRVPVALYTTKFKIVESSYWDEDFQEEVTQIDLQPADDSTVKFTWKDNSLQLVVGEDELFGMAYSDGFFAGIAENGTAITKLTAEAATLPEGAVAEDWQLRFSDAGGAEDGTLVKVAVVGKEIYMSGMSEMNKSAWVRGVIDGNKVLFPSNQYLGINKETFCHSVFTGAIVEATYDEVYDDYNYDITPTEGVSFVYDAAAKVMTSDDTMVINSGVVEFQMVSVMVNPEVKVYSPQGNNIVLKDPEITYYMPYTPSWELGAAEYTIPRFDANGTYLDPSKMYYNIYFDDEKLVCYKDEFFGLPDETTDIPCTYEDNYSVWYTGANYTINFYDGGFEKFGIQVFYKDGDNVIASKLVYYGEAGVEDAIDAADVESVVYYDLTGRVVEKPEAGIYVRSMTYSDGKVRTQKVVVK